MIRTKRNSLETFIKEQLVGPGGCKGLYSLKTISTSKEEAENLGEVINTTPGSIYSSAILFPAKKESTAIEATKLIKSELAFVETPNEDYEQENEIEEIIDNSQDNEDEDLYSLSRRFPSSMGISCCLDSSFENDNDLKIIISGRYYTKLKQHTQLEVVIEEKEAFTAFFKKNNDVLNWFEFDGSKLSLRQTIPQAQLKTYKERLRDLNIQITKEIAKNPDGSFDSIFNNPSFKEQFRFLSSYKERLFKNISTLKDNDTYLTEQEVEIIKQRIASIEQYETFLSYLEDLISICDSRNFGYWIEHPFSKEIDLSSLNFNVSLKEGKVIYSPKKHKCLKDIIAVKINNDTELSLSAWLQLIKTKDCRTYLKILLNNSSTEVTTDQQHYYSIVSEMVNERSFFGTKIEAISRHLCPYKNFQSDSLDDNEALNLNFLYRKVKDYGVGHLCSIDWKMDTDGSMHIFSEFTPSIETPDIEPIPRDKTREIVGQDGYILPQPYLENNQCLQFKWLSFFSETSNEAILNGLLDFISTYKIWIDAQKDHIKETGGHKNATQNIEACEIDYERMRHNVEEFLSDTVKMSTFRAMNAAMFMQLWHNKKENQKQVREDKPTLTYDIYKKAPDDIFPG
ncbi:MAG: hypothetical protein K2K06_01995, partial [Oscillospiraceae bacterium]|nr:hypothetical protein [Oscillospiraceae bacterium]